MFTSSGQYLVQIQFDWLNLSEIEGVRYGIDGYTIQNEMKCLPIDTGIDSRKGYLTCLIIAKMTVFIVFCYCFN